MASEPQPLTTTSHSAAGAQPASASMPGPNQTFRLPSTTLFLGLMPVFSGLARRADLASVLSDEADKQDSAGNVRPARVHSYIVYSGREAQAKTSLSLFDDDPLWNEGELSTLIKRQFGPTGLKHLLGVMIAAEEQAASPASQPGAFVFDASRHLDILGYSRSNRVNGKGYHTAKHLKEAREIVMLLCSLTIVQETRLGPRRGATLKVRLLQDEASAESWEETVADGDRLKERIVTNEKIFLRFNPHLFNAAAEGTSQTQYLYTLQLKKLSRENARTHGLTLTLGVHLPIKFRLNGCQPLTLTARSFLRMAGIAEDEYTRYEHLDRLENTLRHMVEQGYIASFETQRYRYITRETPPPVSIPNVRTPRAQLELKPNSDVLPPEPLEEMWTVEPPGFLRELLKTAQNGALSVQQDLKSMAESSGPRSTRASQPLLPGVEAGGRPPEASELLKRVRMSLKLQQAELARRLGVTQAAVSMAEAGKRPRMAQRLLELARRLSPDGKP
ncbi:MAG TPA: helix-turn-helix transcriptional regulator [Planctomycetota bacterium]|nr:helix-turn-helix transcriptional regulator [Planctomycetota bacterium]